MNYNIIPEYIKIFEIDDLCMKKNSCMHSCTIIYNNGKQDTRHLNGSVISSAIENLGKDKIIGNHQHFPKNKRPIPDDYVQTVEQYQFNSTVLSVYSFVFSNFR